MRPYTCAFGHGLWGGKGRHLPPGSGIFSNVLFIRELKVYVYLYIYNYIYIMHIDNLLFKPSDWLIG